ncbi:MAG: FMN-binding glutamate synthase family protein [Firmicutes bacterium]|nr:FMN-binding glutamate synthase family protein [Bacillota bacterium]
MTFMKPNASAATRTKWRTPDSVSPFSGLCSVCLQGCTGTCEVGRSAVRGREVLYPQPFGKVTAAAEKDYPVDYSHFNINGTAVGALGVPADSDSATFPSVDLGFQISNKNGTIKLRAPFVFPGQGSTDIARINWDGFAAGAALSGVILTVGENVCGMDPDLAMKNGSIGRSPELERRIRKFKEWYDGYGTIVVQENVEDSRLGTLEYAIGDLGVDFVELKWGQGAKDIGGEVKLPTLERAKMLRERGYIVLPDPFDQDVARAFHAGAFDEFERHSRLGMVSEEGFHSRVEKLRRAGARFISLKTGAYRPADLARAVKYSSDARVDLLVVDGAGGGTGMSPWRMMNEWGIPTVYLEALLYDYLSRMVTKGCYVPPVAIAGGLSLEDHVFKALALGAPHVKMVGLGRSPMTAAMVGTTIGELVQEGKAPKDLGKHGDTIEQVFSVSVKLRERLGAGEFAKLPAGAIGVYSYVDRLVGGLQQLMAGARKFRLEFITRDDICSLTREAADVTGIPYVMELDREESAAILGC